MNRNKEGVVIQVDPNIPEPYLTYIKQRNGNVGRDIADHLGLPYVGDSQSVQRAADYYPVLARTITREQARILGAENTDDFYGLAVEDLNVVGKSILHPSVSRRHPAFHREQFAMHVLGQTLPGITGFSKEEILMGYDTGYADALDEALDYGEYGLRMKLPNESDGVGQFTVYSKADVASILEGIDDRDIREQGLVLEADVRNPETISVGFAKIGQEQLSFIARQKDARVWVDHNGRKVEQNRYGGAHVVVANGPLQLLLQATEVSSHDRAAVEKALVFQEAYQRTYDPLASRLSFDVIFGEGKTGKSLSGISDITGRLGGTCPALMRAAEEFQRDPSVQMVATEVSLNYTPHVHKAEEDDAKIYVDHSTLRLTARVNARHRRLAA